MDEYVRSVRERRPATYSIKIESFTSLKNAIAESGQKDHVVLNFVSGTYEWALCLYPEGNKKDDGNNHISLYLRLVSLLKGNQEINVIFNFFVYDQLRDNYLIIRCLKEKRFHTEKREWGLSRLISLSDFKDASKGYLKEDRCSFGVEIFHTDNVEPQVAALFTSTKTKLKSYSFKWETPKFSKLKIPFEQSPEFSINHLSWRLRIYADRKSAEEPQWLSLYLILFAADDYLREGDKILVEADFSLENQANPKGKDYSDIKTFCHWFLGVDDKGYGDRKFIQLDKLQDFKKNDRMIIRVHVKELAILKSM